MAEPIKSALFVDYESLHRSLTGVDARTDVRLAERAAEWIGAIESGRLIGPGGTRRQLVLRRCYAGPGMRGKQRDAFAAAGFSVTDVGADNGARSTADLHIAMDMVDALGGSDAPAEFIVLSAGTELAPLLTRLHGRKRATAIYADTATTAGDRSLADATLDAAAFTEFLLSEEKAPAAGESVGIDRAEIEAFARRIHAATNIPLFSPRTFAELFRHLTDEISENGYHFQSTAKNVAERMMASGRNVTRRQVVFIVKGLALKGHVFSTGDTPERLAEVFREQAHYLITNAGIALDEKQEMLLSAWFKSTGAPAAAARAEPKPAPSPAKLKPPAPAPQKPTAQAKPPATVKPVDLPKPAARPAPPPVVRTGPSAAAREEAKAVIAARIAASAKLKPGRTMPVPAKPAPKAPSPRPHQHPQSPPAHGPAKPPPADEAAPPAAAHAAPPQDHSDALENSILAAIAQAVDVLVEDSSEGKRHSPRTEPLAHAEHASRTEHASHAEHASRTEHPSRGEHAPRHHPAEPEERPVRAADGNGEAADAEDEESDIGDQIQRIIASYNRNRADD